MGGQALGQAEVDGETTGRGQPAEFVSASPAMDIVWRMVDRVAATDVPGSSAERAASARTWWPARFTPAARVRSGPS